MHYCAVHKTTVRPGLLINPRNWNPRYARNANGTRSRNLWGRKQLCSSKGWKEVAGRPIRARLERRGDESNQLKTEEVEWGAALDGSAWQRTLVVINTGQLGWGGAGGGGAFSTNQRGGRKNSSKNGLFDWFFGSTHSFYYTKHNSCDVLATRLAVTTETTFRTSRVCWLKRYITTHLNPESCSPWLIYIIFTYQPNQLAAQQKSLSLLENGIDFEILNLKRFL